MHPMPTPQEVQISELTFGELVWLWWSQAWRQCLLFFAFLPLIPVVTFRMWMPPDWANGWVAIIVNTVSFALTGAAVLAYWYLWLKWVLRSDRGPVRIAVIRDWGSSALDGPWCGTGMYPARALYEDQVSGASGSDDHVAYPTSAPSDASDWRNEPAQRASR